MSKNSLVLHLRRRRNTAAEKKANGVFLIISRFRGKHQARLNWQSSLSSVITAKEGTGMLASISDWFRGRFAGLSLSLVLSSLITLHITLWDRFSHETWSWPVGLEWWPLSLESPVSAFPVLRIQVPLHAHFISVQRIAGFHIANTLLVELPSLAPQQRQLLKCVQADRWGPPLWTPRLPV